MDTDDQTDELKNWWHQGMTIAERDDICNAFTILVFQKRIDKGKDVSVSQNLLSIMNHLKGQNDYWYKRISLSYKTTHLKYSQMY